MTDTTEHGTQKKLERQVRDYIVGNFGRRRGYIVAWLAHKFFEEDDRAKLLFYKSMYEVRGAGTTEKAIRREISTAEMSEDVARLYIACLIRCADESAVLSFVNRYISERESDIFQEANFKYKQKIAGDKDRPAVLFMTLPKSGTLFLMNTIRNGLDVPYCALTPIGFSMNAIELRTQQFSAGGAVAAEHMAPNEQNLNLLYSHGIRKFVFHWRDVRQAALSWVYHMTSDEMGASGVPKWELQRRQDALSSWDHACEHWYLGYLREWCNFAEEWFCVIDEDDRFEIIETTFDEMADEATLIGKILEFLGMEQETFAWDVVSTKSREERAGHFRKGLRDEWRDSVNPKILEEAHQIIRQHPRLTKRMAALSQDEFFS